MGPLHPGIHGALSCLRQAELHEQGHQARLAHSAVTAGRTGRGVARALRSLADRLDPCLEAEIA